MATIRKRNGRWHVQIRKAGARPVSKTFGYQKDAESWAKTAEREIEIEGCGHSKRQLLSSSFADLVSVYEEEEGRHNKSYHVERYYLRRLLREPFSQLTLAQLGPGDIQQWVNQQRRTHKPSSIARQIGLISRVFNVAIKRWGYPIDNPTLFVTKPKVRPPHIARIQPELLDIINKPTSRFEWLVVLALETGMRRGEIISLKWENYFPEKRLVQVLQTKNGSDRLVPLSKRAAEALEHGDRKSEAIFPMTGNAVKLAWRRLKQKHNIAGVRFHDLRHEAISSLFERGLSLPEVALISGHKDPRMLMRYTHLRAEELAKKLG